MKTFIGDYNDREIVVIDVTLNNDNNTYFLFYYADTLNFDECAITDCTFKSWYR